MPDGDEIHLEKVIWADAFKSEETVTIREAAEVAPEDYLVHTVGWIIRDDEHWLVLAHELFDDDHCRGATSIPAGWVLKREKLVSSPAKARKK